MNDDSVRERIARNNYTFREANEQIRAKADEYDAPVERIPFLCECPRPDCTEILRLTVAEYADVRANPAHFFIAPNHEEAESQVGHVVSREQGYVVMEKDADLGDG
jgi:L-lactate utilization protein LutB